MKRVACWWHGGGQAGAMSAGLALLLLAFLPLLGLMFDGGAALTADQRAANLAEQAARAGAQQLSIASIRSGGPYRLDPPRARQAATSYLARAGAQGRVRVVRDARGDRVDVTVTWSRPTVFLGLVGVPRFAGTATASARSCYGVTREEGC